MNLQINNLDGPTLAAIISIVSVSFAGTGLFFTAKSFRENTKSQYVRMLKEFHSEITSLESSQERNYDYDLFAPKYLNLHDTIAYLAIKKIIQRISQGSLIRPLE